MPIEHTIELCKTGVNTLNPDKLHKQVDQILERVNNASRKARGWSARRGVVCSVNVDSQLVYKIKLTFDLKIGKEQNDIDFASIVDVVEKAGNAPRWQVTSVDGVARQLREKRIEYIDLEIPEDWGSYFSHLYGLDNQITIAMSRVQAAIDSEWQNRFHCAFVGDPASGKTETARTFKMIFGEDAVLEYDATSTTMAGAIKDLDSRESLPRILVVEEIEKADEDSFRWLLGVLDWRAEIRKVNFRQYIQRETKLLGIVTINDYEKFGKLHAGALASRCGDPIWFPKPTRQVLKLILEREVNKIAGDPRWIEPTLDYASKVGMSDPRHVTAVCLCGKEKLLTGEYQQQLLSVRLTTKP